jgi:hypothetical protein
MFENKYVADDKSKNKINNHSDTYTVSSCDEDESEGEIFFRSVRRQRRVLPPVPNKRFRSRELDEDYVEDGFVVSDSTPIQRFPKSYNAVPDEESDNDDADRRRTSHRNSHEHIRSARTNIVKEEVDEPDIIFLKRVEHKPQRLVPLCIKKEHPPKQSHEDLEEKSADESYAEEDKNLNSVYADEDDDNENDMERKDEHSFEESLAYQKLKKTYPQECKYFSNVVRDVQLRSHMLKKYRPTARHKLVLEYLRLLDLNAPSSEILKKTEKKDNI